jgi:RNA polymerase sigma factor (sigma-70 family)
MENTPIERKKEELIRSTEDPAFREKVHQYAYKLTGNRMDAEDYSQEALTRFISIVKSKTSIEELERMRPLPYVSVILRNMHADTLRKKSMPQGKTVHQTDQSQGDASGQGRQKWELLAALTRGSVEDIANHHQEEGKIQSTRLGVEEQVVSEAVVDAFIKSLPEDLRELARLLTFEEYKLNELTGILKRSYKELKSDKRRIRDALQVFQQQQQIQREEMRSTHGR